MVHKSEGRVFLTDRNGFYNDLLADEWAKRSGEVLIVLTANRNKVPEDKLTNSDTLTMSQ